MATLCGDRATFTLKANFEGHKYQHLFFWHKALGPSGVAILLKFVYWRIQSGIVGTMINA